MIFSLFFACPILKNISEEETEELKDPVKVDILIVMDNSSSMWNEGASFGLHLENLLEEKDDQKIDYQIGITTSTVDYTSTGNSEALEAGEAGLLIGDIISSSDENALTHIKEQLFCNTIYWDSTVLFAPENQDSDYVCGDETEEISIQYLDCLCGTNNWENPIGSGQEELLEAALLATCRTKDSAPESCYDPVTPFSDEDLLSNDNLFRDNAEALVIFIGDEGDHSRRLASGESTVDIYTEAFQAFQKHNFHFIAFGPNYNESDDLLRCNNGGATDWSVIRLYSMSSMYDNEGLYLPLETEDGSGNCQPADFSAHMSEINDLIYTLD